MEKSSTYMCVGMSVSVSTEWEILMIYMNKKRKRGFFFLKNKTLHLLSAVLFQLKTSPRRWIHWKTFFFSPWPGTFQECLGNAMKEFACTELSKKWKMMLHTPIWRNLTISVLEETEYVTHMFLQERKFILVNGDLKNQVPKTLIS